MPSERRFLVRPEVAQVHLLDEVLTKIVEMNSEVNRLRIEWEQTQPEGIIEPLSPLTVTTVTQTVHPPYYLSYKYWFGMTIVKEDAVEMSITVKTMKPFDSKAVEWQETDTSMKPYVMSASEKVFDLYFNRPCIRDVLLWTSSGTATVRIRGTR